MESLQSTPTFHTDEQTRGLLDEYERLKRMFLLTQEEMMNLRLQALQATEALETIKSEMKQVHNRELEEMRLMCSKEKEEMELICRTKMEELWKNGQKEKQELRLKCMKDKEAMRAKFNKKGEEMGEKLKTQQERHEAQGRDMHQRCVAQVRKWEVKRNEEKKAEDAKYAKLQEEAARDVKKAVDGWSAYYEAQKMTWNEMCRRDKETWCIDQTNRELRDQQKWHSLIEEIRKQGQRVWVRDAGAMWDNLVTQVSVDWQRNCEKKGD